jgi:hypothetical protein
MTRSTLNLPFNRNAGQCQAQKSIDNPHAGMTEFRSELGIAPSPMGIYGIAVPDSFLHLYPHFSWSCISPFLEHRQSLFAHRAQRRARGSGGRNAV